MLIHVENFKQDLQLVSKIDWHKFHGFIRRREALKRYLETGDTPTDLLVRTVLRNDLTAAITSFPRNRFDVEELVTFCYYNIPNNAWGSLDAMGAWWYAHQTWRKHYATV